MPDLRTTDMFVPPIEVVIRTFDGVHVGNSITADDGG